MHPKGKTKTTGGFLDGDNEFATIMVTNNIITKSIIKIAFLSSPNFFPLS